MKRKEKKNKECVAGQREKRDILELSGREQMGYVGVTWSQTSDHLFFFFGIGLGHYTFAPVTRILFVCALLVVAAVSK